MYGMFKLILLGINIIVFAIFIIVRMFKVKNNFQKLLYSFYLFVFIFINAFIYTSIFGVLWKNTKDDISYYKNVTIVEVYKSNGKYEIIRPIKYYNYELDFSYYNDESEITKITNYPNDRSYNLKAIYKDGKLTIIDFHNIVLLNKDNVRKEKLNIVETKNFIILFHFLTFGLFMLALIIFMLLVKFNRCYDLFEFKEYLYIFPTSLFNSSQIVLFFITLYKTIEKLILASVSFDLDIIIFTITGFNIVVKTIIDVYNYRKSFNHFIDKDLGIDIYDNIELNELDKQNEYKISVFKNKENIEYYFMSNKVNEYLFNTQKLKFDFQKRREYVLPIPIRANMPYALEQKLSSNSKLYNDAILRMSNDLYVPLENMKEDNEKPSKPKRTIIEIVKTASKQLFKKIKSIKTKNNKNKKTEVEKERYDIEIGKTSYFDALSTNHIVNKELFNKVSERNKFDGHSYVIKTNCGEKELISLKNSSLSNHIGINTLAITNDNYIVVNTQGEKSGVNQGRLVNTGSGSLSYKDYKKNKRKTFNELFIYGVERELLEETGFKVRKYNMKKINTKLFGYIRVLNYGGKPDFFGVSVLNFSKSEIEAKAQKSREFKSGLMGKPIFSEIIKGDIEQSIINCIEELEIKEKVSVQLHITKEILKYFVSKGYKVFDNDLFRFEKKK